MKVIVLGAGRVGGAIARDLVATGQHDVAVADIAAEPLTRLKATSNLTAVRCDLAAEGEIERAIAGHDLVVGAVPGPMGFATLRRVIDAGIDVVDISFFEEDPWPLHQLAVDRGVRAVMDCGIAPGMSNLILGRAEASWDRVDAFRCYVGGLPQARQKPFEYKAVFSPIDVIAEYLRPARLVEGGRVISRPALSEIEEIDFAEIGTLEAFNTDGLRTLLVTSKIPDMKEKTMRYPGHADLMRTLRDAGFFGTEPIRAGDVEVRPLDLTARLLIPAWRLRDGEADLTVMRIEIDGVRGGSAVRQRFDLLDRYDSETNTISMARTTGYTCTAGVRILADGLHTEPGLSPPEYLGRSEVCFQLFLDHLAERGVHFKISEQEIAAR